MQPPFDIGKVDLTLAITTINAWNMSKSLPHRLKPQMKQSFSAARKALRHPQPDFSRTPGEAVLMRRSSEA
jgi:hypothetical protein